MKITNEDFVTEYNLADDIVLSAVFNFETREYDIKLTAIHRNVGNKWQEIKDAKIVISNWKSLSATVEDIYKPIATLPCGDYEPLTKILYCEFDGKLQLGGFGQITGRWIEYNFLEPDVELFF